MRHLLLIILPLIILYSATAHTVPDTTVINNTPLTYYYIKSTKEQKNGLIIYMHGGVSQFKGKATPVDISPIELLEGNEEFLPAVNDAGYDIILPIAYNEHNWLENAGEDFIMQLVAIHGSRYKHTYISGFSDGGTGAFRFLYNHPQAFTGMMMFNGYPQLQNYYKNVDHTKGIGKNMLYVSTEADETIPYEFLLIEYRRQQMLNKHTYFILREGGHSFKAFSKEDFVLCLHLLSKPAEPVATAERIWIYPPIDGLVIDGFLKESYSFRKKTGKNYSMAKTEYQRNDYDMKHYDRLLSNNVSVQLKGTEVDTAALTSSPTFSFYITSGTEKEKVTLTNWLATPTW